MARRMAQNWAPTHEIERQGRWAAAWSAATPAANPPGPLYAIYNVDTYRYHRRLALRSG